MAQFETWLKSDLQQPVKVIAVQGNVFTQDNMANRVGVEVYDGGEAVTLSGSVQGYIIRTDDATVVQTGSLSGNKAWIDLPESAYAVPGQIQIAIRLVSGQTKTVLGACTGYVVRSVTSTIIDPGEVVPDIADLLAMIAECEAATDGAENVNITQTKTGSEITITTTDRDGVQTANTISGGSPAITDTASGAIASFPDGADNVPMDSVKVQIEPVQDLHGYPSPWSAGAGKNVFDKSILQSNTNVSVSQTDNAIVLTQLAAGTFKSSSEYFSFTGHDGETLYVKADITVSASNIGYLSVQFYNASAEVDSTKRIELSNRSTAPKSNTVPTGTTRIRIMTYVNSNGTGVVGNTATFANVILSLSDVPYSPYSNVCPISGWTGANVVHSPTDDAEDGTTYPFTWSQAGTVYGGELNVTTGVLTVDSANISSYAGETLPGKWISDRDAYAAGTTPTTGAQVVYKLATPVTYQLTTTQINTLLGQNNVWADTGNTEATYKADTKLYIDKRINALIAQIVNA